MIIERYWAMPNRNTFSIKPIGEFVEKYSRGALVTIDPFARNHTATFTNDLNPDTEAEYHMKAVDFLAMLESRSIKADLVFFDPPYSLRQVKECYNGIGEELEYKDTINGYWKDEKKLINKLTAPGAVVLSFGWNSSGMGKKYGFKIIEIMLVCHGGAHNDTICMAEMKVTEQGKLVF